MSLRPRCNLYWTRKSIHLLKIVKSPTSSRSKSFPCSSHTKLQHQGIIDQQRRLMLSARCTLKNKLDCIFKYANLILMPFCVIARKLVSLPVASAGAARLTRFSPHHREFFFTRSPLPLPVLPVPANCFIQAPLTWSVAEDNQFFQVRSDLPPLPPTGRTDGRNRMEQKGPPFISWSSCHGTAFIVLLSIFLFVLSYCEKHLITHRLIVVVKGGQGGLWFLPEIIRFPSTDGELDRNQVSYSSQLPQQI